MTVGSQQSSLRTRHSYTVNREKVDDPTRAKGKNTKTRQHNRFTGGGFVPSIYDAHMYSY